MALLRAEPAVFGRVASDPTVSRTVDRLAVDPEKALKAVDTARALAQARVWELAGTHAPHAGVSAENPLVVDLDATLVTARSEKGNADRTWKKGFGFHPLWASADHGAEGSGERGGTTDEPTRPADERSRLTRTSPARSSTVQAPCNAETGGRSPSNGLSDLDGQRHVDSRP